MSSEWVCAGWRWVVCGAVVLLVLSRPGTRRRLAHAPTVPAATSPRARCSCLATAAVVEGASLGAFASAASARQRSPGWAWRAPRGSVSYRRRQKRRHGATSIDSQPKILPTLARPALHPVPCRPSRASRPPLRSLLASATARGMLLLLLLSGVVAAVLPRGRHPPV
jgi:hypothetical protein